MRGKGFYLLKFKILTEDCDTLPDTVLKMEVTNFWIRRTRNMKITMCNISAGNYKVRDRNFKGAFYSYNNLSCHKVQIFFITITVF